MSFQTFVTERLSAITAQLNGITTNAKKIDELTVQSTLDPTSKIHVSKAGVSESLSVQKIIDAVSEKNFSQLLEVGEITVSGLTIYVPANALWVYEGVNYQTTAITEIPETLCAAGFLRKDILVGNQSNEIVLIKGTESETIRIMPNIPIGSVLVTEIDVDDTVIGTPAPIILGGDYIPKIEKSHILLQSSGVLDFHPFAFKARYNSIVLDGTYTSLGGVSYSTPSSSLYTGRKLTIRNNQATAVTLLHNSSLAAVKFMFPNLVDFVIKPKEVIEFIYRPNTSSTGWYDFVGNINDIPTVEIADVAGLTAELAAKLDASSYNQHFKGKYTTSGALTTAHPTATDGDYAIVDSGTGVDAKEWIWDNEAGWIVGGATGASTTDGLSEGSTNLYFTTARALATLLTGLSVLTGGAIVSTDSVLVAFGKIQKQITDLLATGSRLITSGEITILSNTSGINSGNETAATIAAIGHAASAKTVLVDADEVTGQNSASSFGLIRTVWSDVWTYIKSKADVFYQSKSQDSFIIKHFKSYFTAITGYTTTGFTPTYSDGKMVFTGGVNDFTKYITIDGLKNTDENIEIEVIYKVTAIGATGYGLGIGKRSINTWAALSVCCQFSPILSTMNIWDGVAMVVPTNLIGTKKFPQISVNDIIKQKYTQIGNSIIYSIENITTKIYSELVITANLGTTNNFSLPNSANICIWNMGSTNEIMSIKTTSLSTYQPDIICIGDSKTFGNAATDINLRWANNINSLGTVIVNAASADRTVEATQTIDYAKAIKAKYAIVAIGRNDLSSGVASGTWQTNYANIVTQLQSVGTIVIHLLPIPETLQADQSALNTWIIATYGSGNCIDIATGWSNATMLSSDTVHPNVTGHLFIAKKIIDSGLIVPPNPLKKLLPIPKPLVPYINDLSIPTQSIGGTIIFFNQPMVYGTAVTAETANITNDLTDAKVGIIQKIYHTSGTAPTYPAGWVLIGSGIYSLTVQNKIYAEFVGGTRVEYWITQ